MRRRDLLAAALAAIPARAQSPDPHADLHRRLAPPTGPVRIILDTDARNEIDDPFAIAHALLSPDRITVEALYAGPFVNSRAATAEEGMEQSYDEILHVLDKLGRKPAPGFVMRGSRRYLTGAPEPPQSPAVDDLIRRGLEDRPEPLYAVSLGCPTNISAALVREPRLAQKIVVLWIGGQPYASDSATDYNIKQDYEASRILYDSGVALMVVEPAFGIALGAAPTDLLVVFEEHVDFAVAAAKLHSFDFPGTLYA